MPLKLSEYLSVMLECDGEQTDRSRTQQRDLMQEWRTVYAASLYAATGKWRLHELDWHVFSYEHSRAVSGCKALDVYREEQPDSFLVLPEEASRLPGLHCRGTRLPNFMPYFVDIYIFPEDLSWTMAFTHEADTSMELGPFFCRREWIACGPRRSRRRR